MNKWDVVLIRYPFSDLSGSKVRPAVVMSSTSYNKKGEDALFVLISSNIGNPQPTDYLIDKDDIEFSKTGLKTASIIRTDKIVYLTKKLAIRKLGKIGPNAQKEIENRFKAVFDLGKPPIKNTTSSNCK